MNVRVLLRRVAWSRWIIAAVTVVAALVVGWVAMHDVAWRQMLSFGNGGDDAEKQHAADRQRQTTPAASAEVRLSPEKIQAAGIHVGRARLQAWREMRTVPGNIEYDAARHLELAAPVECVVKQVLVEPGQSIQDGDPLVVLSSSEIGLARDEVIKHEADLALSRTEAKWSEQIDTNVGELLMLLKSRPAIGDLEQQLAGKPLGAYRERLIAAYSKLVFAELVMSSSADLEIKGTLSKRLIDERRSNREVASATFQGACENSRFEATQQRDRTKALAEQAERLLAVSRERLSSMLGPNSAAAGTAEGESLSEFIVRAPFAGRVETRHVVRSARIALGKPLFDIADTSRLWVAAEIHERDWRALEFAAGTELTIRVPALDDAEFQVQVRFVGSQLSADTRSVPLVADLANDAGRFKPGMFVWVNVPLSSERQAIIVPAGAVMRHEAQAFVFVPEGDGAFRRVDVQTGLETSAEIELISGLRDGQPVVDRGAAFLKTELLLDREAD